MSKRLHLFLVLGLIAIFLVGVGVGLSQKSQFMGSLFNQPVASQQPVIASETLEVIDVTVEPTEINVDRYEKSTLTYTITKQAQVSAWIEGDEGSVIRLLRPATTVAPGIFTESWDGRVVGQAALLGRGIDPASYVFVVMAIDLETDAIVQVREEVKLVYEETEDAEGQ